MEINDIKINFSRKKIITILLLSIVLSTLTIAMFLYPEKFTSSLLRSELPLIIGGIIGTLFLFLSVCFLLSKVFKKTAIVISEKGIYDRTNIISVGFIPWEDITGIRTAEIKSNKVLLIDVKNPNKYIKSSKNIIQKTLIKINYQSYKTPISLNAKMLECSFSELERIIIDSFEKKK